MNYSGQVLSVFVRFCGFRNVVWHVHCVVSSGFFILVPATTCYLPAVSFIPHPHTIPRLQNTHKSTSCTFMPPQGHRRPQVAHSSFHSPIRRQAASSTSHVLRDVQLTPSSVDSDRQSQGDQNTAVVTVSVAAVVSLLVCGAVFFLVQYKRKCLKAVSPPISDKCSQTEVDGLMSAKGRCFRLEEQRGKAVNAKSRPMSLRANGHAAVVPDDTREAQRPKNNSADRPGMNEAYIHTYITFEPSPAAFVFHPTVSRNAHTHSQFQDPRQ